MQNHSRRVRHQRTRLWLTKDETKQIEVGYDRMHEKEYVRLLKPYYDSYIVIPASIVVELNHPEENSWWGTGAIEEGSRGSSLALTLSPLEVSLT